MSCCAEITAVQGFNTAVQGLLLCKDYIRSVSFRNLPNAKLRNIFCQKQKQNGGKLTRDFGEAAGPEVSDCFIWHFAGL